MTRQHIVREIRRTAAANGGVALGQKRFFLQTGIKYADWFGKYWSHWGDAVQEAGFVPNKLQEAYAEELLVQKYAEIIQELGRIPVKGELRLKRRKDPSFPNEKTFARNSGKD